MGATPTKRPRRAPAARPAVSGLSMAAVLAAINDSDGDQDVVAALNAALYRFGAQDQSMQLRRSWQRVQRRIGVDPNKLDGYASAEQVAAFAARVGLDVR